MKKGQRDFEKPHQEMTVSREWWIWFSSRFAKSIFENRLPSKELQSEPSTHFYRVLEKYNSATC